MISGRAMKDGRADHRLMDLLTLDFVREHTAPRNVLPLGRCACHEPTVRWCTRHGRPIKPAPRVDTSAAA